MEERTITIEDYKKAKDIVEKFEKNLNISDVIVKLLFYLIK